MKRSIAILTDTNSGITPEQASAWGVNLILMPVILGEETCFENVSITPEEFFLRLREGAAVSTSQPAPGVLMDCWEDLLERNDTVIYIPMSGGLSGSCQTASMLAREYDGRVRVVDNRRISVTLRQSVLDAVRWAEEGVDGGTIVSRLEEDGGNASIYVAVNTLEYLKRSGRVTAAGAALGTVLNLKPVLQIQGKKLDAWKRTRGMKSAMQSMIEALEQDRQIRFPGKKVVIRGAYSQDLDAGLAWQAELQKAFPDLWIGLDPLPISICCHTGEGALGVGMTLDHF